MKFLKDLLSTASFLSLAVTSTPLISGPNSDLQSRQTSLISCLNDANVPYYTPSSSNWTEYVKPYNLRLQYVPTAIAVPTEIKHIYDGVVCASENGVKVQAKSGGHSYASFSSGGKNGSLIVDLENYNSITVDDSTFIAQVGAGVRLGNLGLSLWEQGKRALPYGSCPGVGLGGHFLHGGYGHSSRRWGLALDTIVALDVVLANGTFVHATPTDWPEVFFAMRGAGDSFGIATTFYLQTVPAPENVVNWQVTIPRAVESAATVNSGFMKLQQLVLDGNAEFDRNTSFGIQYGGTELLLIGWYLGPSYNTFNEVTLPAILSGWPTPETRNLTNMTWLDSLAWMAAPDPLSQPLSGYDEHDTFYAKSIVTKEAEPITEAASLSFWTYAIQKAQAISSVGYWFTIINIYGGHDSQINVPAVGSSAYGDRDSLWVFQNYGSSGSNPWSPTIETFIDGLNNALTSAEPAGNFSAYLNYVDPELSPTQAAQLYYGQDLYNQLVGIKNVIDPQNVFWNPQTIGSEGNSSTGSSVPLASTDGSCGGEAGTTCMGSTFGICCSQNGYCGTGALYCDVGCQSAWGTCEISRSSPTTSISSLIPPPTHSMHLSNDGSCGEVAASSCNGSAYGNCCSQYNNCGTGVSWCGVGCQSTYGVCDILGDESPNSDSSSTIPLPVRLRSPAVATPSPIPTFPAIPASATVPGNLAVSDDGGCGAVASTTCQGSTFGLCCSSYNFCGTGDLWCGVGCQSGYGFCDYSLPSIVPSALPSSTPIPEPPVTPPLEVSNDGACGAIAGMTCAGSLFGTCCSSYNYCGTGDLWCGEGCQDGFGECNASPSSPAMSTPTSSAVPVVEISTNGTCGIDVRMTCTGSSFGDCCSSYNYCGTGDLWCGTGCQDVFGSCDPSPIPAPSSVSSVHHGIPTPPAITGTPPPKSPPGLISSVDGTCGGTTGYTCSGPTEFSKGIGAPSCCSPNGWCGVDADYCGTGCQPEFGYCDVA